jgi:hypothetical protein
MACGRAGFDREEEEERASSGARATEREDCAAAALVREGGGEAGVGGCVEFIWRKGCADPFE